MSIIIKFTHSNKVQSFPKVKESAIEENDTQLVI